MFSKIAKCLFCRTNAYLILPDEKSCNFVLPKTTISNILHLIAPICSISLTGMCHKTNIPTSDPPLQPISIVQNLLNER